MDDSRLLVIFGLCALALAAWAWLGDRRRMRRSDPDAVGLMPWASVFFWALLAGVLLVGAGIRLWLRGD